MSDTITCLLLNSGEGLPCLDFLVLLIKSMKMCVTSVVCVVLSLQNSREPGFQAYEPLTLGMSSFVDHAEILLRKNKYMVLLVLGGATNLLWATAQSSLSNEETIQALRLWADENNCMPVQEKGVGFTPGGEIPDSVRTIAWSFMGQEILQNYGKFWFWIALVYT